MSVKREKLVGDDPLSSMLFAPEPEEEKPIPEPRKPHTKNLQNSLSESSSDFMTFDAKPQNITRVQAKNYSNSSNSSVAAQSKSSQTTADAVSPDVIPTVQKKPNGPASVFESGDDIFLKSGDTGISASAQQSLEDELFGPSATPLGSISSSSASTHRAGLGRFNTAYEDEYEEKLDDLGVSNIMEREELDFDLFGKSKVRQLDALSDTPTTAPKIYQEDLTLQSEDEFAAMEAVLSTSSVTKPSFIGATETRAIPTAYVDTSTLDINAYIMQQESDSGAGLFD